MIGKVADEEAAHSAPIKKSSASLLLLFGLRPACGSGLFGAWGNRRWRKLGRLVLLTTLDLAAQDCAIFYDNAARLHVACDSASAGNPDALALKRSNEFTVNDDFAGFDFRGDTRVGTDSETPLGDANFSCELAIQAEIPLTRDFSFDPDASAHVRWRIRRDWRRCIGRTLR